jgi:hypothetical protein
MWCHTHAYWHFRAICCLQRKGSLILSPSSSGIWHCINGWTLEDKTTILSRNAEHQKSNEPVAHLTKTQTSTTPLPIAWILIHPDSVGSLSTKMFHLGRCVIRMTKVNLTHKNCTEWHPLISHAAKIATHDAWAYVHFSYEQLKSSRYWQRKFFMIYKILIVVKFIVESSGFWCHVLWSVSCKYFSVTKYFKSPRQKG